MFAIQNNLVKINRMIYQEKFSKENLERFNQFQETDFIRELKEEELETIKLKNKIDESENKKREYLNEIVENQ